MRQSLKQNPSIKINPGNFFSDFPPGHCNILRKNMVYPRTPYLDGTAQIAA